MPLAARGKLEEATVITLTGSVQQRKQTVRMLDLYCNIIITRSNQVLLLELKKKFTKKTQLAQ